MLRVLIIDDRRTNRSILTRLTKSLDLNIEVLDFGDPASALVDARQATPDLIITDYRMPEMTGAEFVARFRQLAACGDVPVVVVTAYEHLEYRYDALRAGATDFLLTPVDRVEFCARIKNLLTLRRQQKLIERRARMLEQRLAERTQLYERDLIDSEEKLKLVMDTVPAMVNAVDTADRCVFINHRAGVVFGVDPAGIAGKSMDSVFGLDYARRHRELNRAVFETGAPRQSIEETLADSVGSDRTFLTTKAPLLRNDGTVATVVTVSLDITERKTMERELREARDNAQSANRAKNQFLANMSHDLRTPLNAVIGFAGLIASEVAGPIGERRYVDYAGDIERSGRFLLDLVEQVLEASRIELGALELTKEACDVGRLLTDARAIVSIEAERGAVDVDLDIEDGLPPVEADSTRLQQAFINLLSNAIKFTTSGGRVVVRARAPEGAHVSVDVCDTGVGMSPDEIVQARTRFRRIENARTPKRDGLGLGLPLAIDLIQLHGGAVTIESEPWVGTCVRAKLPIAVAASATDKTAGPPSAERAER